MFDDLWGVDVAVSTPRLMCALVEEAVTVGDLVRLFSFRGGHANLVEMTLPDGSPRVGTRVADLNLPGDAVLVTDHPGRRRAGPRAGRGAGGQRRVAVRRRPRLRGRAGAVPGAPGQPRRLNWAEAQPAISS